MRSTLAKIHLKNFEHNIAQIKKKLGQDKFLCLAIKADAYGHGAVRIAECAMNCGVRFFAVAACYEAAELRNGGIKAPILLLSQPNFDEISEIIEYNLTPLVFDKDFAAELQKKCEKYNKNLKVHLKIDTGMHRAGCDVTEALSMAKFIKAQKNLILEGICTHFSVSDSDENEKISFTDLQEKRFCDCVTEIKAVCGEMLVHCANSAAILTREISFCNMARPGLVAYGYVSDNYHDSDRYKPVMELVSKIVAIQNVPKGETVSYGNTWMACRDSKIGIIPIGYADGLFRCLSDKIFVTINGNKYPLVGRICMDQCMVDITDSDVKRFDEVVFFGRNHVECEEIASMADTIPYELLCAVSPRVPRIYMD